MLYFDFTTFAVEAKKQEILDFSLCRLKNLLQIFYPVFFELFAKLTSKFRKI